MSVSIIVFRNIHFLSFFSVALMFLSGKVFGQGMQSAEDSKPLFGLDYKTDGMVIATVLRPPAFGKILESFDATAAKKVKGVIVDQLGVSEDEVTETAKYAEDLGADSLDTVELVMALEEEFGTEIADDEAEKLTDVTKTVEYILAQQ